MIIEEIVREVKQVSVGVELCKNGLDHTLFLQNQLHKQYVLSKYNPRQSARDLIIGAQSSNKQTLWIIVGFMLGYVIDEIVSLVGNEAKIIVIEPSQEALEKQIDKIDVKEYKQYMNLHFLSGADFDTIISMYEQCLDASNFYNTNMIISETYLKFYSKYITYLVKRLKAILEKEVINHNTAKSILEPMIRNNLYNRKAILQSYDIRQHYNKYKDIPALIVSAGPSLEKNIKYINRFKGLVFTGGRTVAPVLKQGGRPDFVGVIDSSELIYDTFQGYAGCDFTLISSAHGCARVIKENTGAKYFVENSMQLTTDLLGVNLESLPIAGTVATLCLSAAVYMGCNPIVFIGQDLAYTNMQTHANSSQVFEKEKGMITVENTRLIPGYNQEQVLSSADLISFLNWIEGFIRSNPGITYINATEGGAKIEGTQQQTFEEVVNTYKCIEKPKIKHQIHIEAPHQDINERIQELLQYVKEIQQLAWHGVNLSNKLMEEMSDIRNQSKVDISTILNKLDRDVDQKIKKYCSRPLLCELFSNAYNDIMISNTYQGKLEETELEQKIRIATLNSMIYEGLEESCKRLVEVINKAMEED